MVWCCVVWCDVELWYMVWCDVVWYCLVLWCMVVTRMEFTGENESWEASGFGFSLPIKG